MMSKKGRPKKDRPIEELNYTTFQQDITMFRNYLIDVVEDEETEDEVLIDNTEDTTPEEVENIATETEKVEETATEEPIVE